MSAFTEQVRFITDQFAVESESNPERKYVVSRYSDGSWACGCIGWTRHVPRQDCKHIWWVKTHGAVRCEMIDPLLAAMRKVRKRKGADEQEEVATTCH